MPHINANGIEIAKFTTFINKYPNTSFINNINPIVPIIPLTILRFFDTFLVSNGKNLLQI
jgi:hypothetical protein